jgi:hypothetical protein
VGVREPSFRLPVRVSVIVSMFVPTLVRSGPGHEFKVMQSLFEQCDKTRYLPGPIFPSGPFIGLGCLPMNPGVLHVIVSLAHLPLGLALAALSFCDAMNDIRDSVVQIAKHVRRTFRNDDRFPHLGRRFMVSRSRIVGAMLIWVMLFSMVIVRAMHIRAMFVRTVLFGATFFGAPVPARLC